MGAAAASIPAETAPRLDGEVPLLRLYVLRAAFLLFAVLGFSVHPQWILDPSPTNRGMILAFTGGLWIMSFFGLRYPLQMLPVLLIQLVYKGLWLLAVALPRWAAGAPFDPLMTSFAWAMAVGAAFDLLVIPWGYVIAAYVVKPAERWTAASQ